MSGIERYGSSGVHTVEGTIAGSRAARLTKEREKQKQEFEQRKEAIKETHLRGARIDKNFTSHREDDEAEFKRQTVGLVTAEEFRRKRDQIRNRSESMEEEDKAQAKPKKATTTGGAKKKKKTKKITNTLSFDLESEEVEFRSNGNGTVAKRKLDDTPLDKVSEKDEDDDEEEARKQSMKNPDVETDFLPDKERDLELQRERKRLRLEWEQEQERIKHESVQVTYSYWDGSGHRKEITVPKMTTIGKYLELVRQQLLTEFPELRGVSPDNLLYVKEDLIIPHNYSFYDLIVTKARGKSGPLFHFDVHEDVRLINDARIEKDESHPGKVVERHWYEKNKHIFPASRWEVYDPSVKREKYTIRGN